jgi:glycosyltransferase involved in cell wall biosynthesis
MYNTYPLVSIVLATYNGERFLKEQLESILVQTYPNIEVIVVDDCSSDNTISILKEFVEKDRRIKIFINEENIGYVRNFEKGLRLASGSYIAPSDQDDIWKEEKISVLMKEMNNYEIVYCNSELIDDNGNSLHKKLSDIKRLLSYDDCLTYAIGNTAPGHGMIITKELVERCLPFPTMIPHDYWLGFVATCRQPIKFVDIPLVKYRQHTQNVFGAVKVIGGKRIKKKANKKKRLSDIRERMRLLYEKCPWELKEQKRIYHDLLKSYESFSLKNDIRRMMLFFKYRDKILAYKNKSDFRKWLFCFKMFFKIK